MLHTPRAMRGMVMAPHHLAAQAGLAVLCEGGNAIEAMVAAAAAIAVLYPLDPEHPLGVRLRRRAQGHGDSLAESRRELRPEGGRLERLAAGQKAIPYPEPGHGPAQRRANRWCTAPWAARGSPRLRPRCSPAVPCLGRDSRRRSRRHAGCSAGRGRHQHQPQAGEPLRPRPHRGAAAGRPRRRSRRPIQRHHGPRRGHRPPPIGCDGRRRRPARRRRGGGILAGNAGPALWVTGHLGWENLDRDVRSRRLSRAL